MSSVIPNLQSLTIRLPIEQINTWYGTIKKNAGTASSFALSLTQVTEFLDLLLNQGHRRNADDMKAVDMNADSCGLDIERCDLVCFSEFEEM